MDGIERVELDRYEYDELMVAITKMRILKAMINSDKEYVTIKEIKTILEA